jgi:hypothetical protein
MLFINTKEDYKMKRGKIVSLALALCLCLALLPDVASAASNGQCGDNVYWTLDDYGTLTISGTGPMWNWWNERSPWNANSSIISVNIISGVTTIGGFAFVGCESLTSVTIPNSVTTIGDATFSGCDLTSVTIPNSVTTIGDSAFGYCENLLNIYVDSNSGYFASIDGVLFSRDGTKILSYPIGRESSYYQIPNNVTAIGDGAFDSCINLTSVTIPNSMMTIGNYAFCGCGLTSVTIPNSVTTIGNAAFSGCGFASVTIPNSVTTIGNDAFSGCDITSVTIPNSVTVIGESAFQACYSLTSVTIPNSVTTISDAAFAYCTNLTNLTISNGVATVGNAVFADCDSLTSVTIPNSVMTIGINAFGRCDSLTSVTIPNSVTTIGNYAFDDCPYLTIYCYPNSYVQQYAIDRDIPYVLLTPPIETVGPFIDVFATDWYADAVRYVNDNGIMTGTSPSTFNPNGKLSRAMLATVLYRLDGEPRTTYSAAYTDVPSGQWYSESVTWASENGIVTGYGGGIFAPNDDLTREQFSTMLHRYARMKGYDVSAASNLSGFSDAGTISDWALDAMRWAVAKGLINGATDTTLDPSGAATRAQCATILMRFVKMLPTDSQQSAPMYTAYYNKLLELKNNAEVGLYNAVAIDLDGDGVEELLCLFVNMYNYENGYIVYKYDPASHQVVLVNDHRDTYIEAARIGVCRGTDGNIYIRTKYGQSGENAGDYSTYMSGEWETVLNYINRDDARWDEGGKNSFWLNDGPEIDEAAAEQVFAQYEQEELYNFSPYYENNLDAVLDDIASKAGLSTIDTWRIAYAEILQNYDWQNAAEDMLIDYYGFDVLERDSLFLIIEENFSSRFALCDIDNSGIPELLVSCDFWIDGAGVLHTLKIIGNNGVTANIVMITQRQNGGYQSDYYLSTDSSMPGVFGAANNLGMGSRGITKYYVFGSYDNLAQSDVAFVQCNPYSDNNTDTIYWDTLHVLNDSFWEIYCTNSKPITFYEPLDDNIKHNILEGDFITANQDESLLPLITP